MPLSFRIITLGCKLNYAESSALQRTLCAAGLRFVPDGGDACACIINSCAVTLSAEKKCRAAMRRAAQHHSIVVLTGCYASLLQRLPTDAPSNIVLVPKKEDVAAALLASAAGSAVSIVPTEQSSSFYPAYSLSGRTRSFLKVQDGCDYWCAYCTVPHARGRSRSADVEEVVAQARTIAASGVKEIVLTGINIGTYRSSDGRTLANMLTLLHDIEGVERWRISSIEPNLLTSELIDIIAGSTKIMPHLHIPLQAGSDRILRLMRRRYSLESFQRKVESILRCMPHAFIGIDIIAGFPTETSTEFEDACGCISTLGAARLHVFPYSMRPNTTAAALPQLPPQVIAARTRILTELSESMYNAFSRQFIGTTLPVLYESAVKGGMQMGFTPNYIRVAAPADASLTNTIVPTLLTADNLR